MTELHPFKPEYLDALYEISLATGLAGGDASAVYHDKRLIGHIYCAPYALLDPGLTMVAVDSQGVGGFVVGTHDTAAWEDRLEREWWPQLRTVYPAPADTEGLQLTPDQRRLSMILTPERTPAEIAQLYPGHLHMNILPRLQNQGVGSMLLEKWLEVARRRGVRAVHIGVNRLNARGIRFWRGRGFHEISIAQSESRTLWLGRHL